MTEIKDSWGLLTELARINNQDLGIDNMLKTMEAHPEFVDINHVTVLLDYIELIEENVRNDMDLYKKVRDVLAPHEEKFKLRSIVRYSLLEGLIKTVEQTQTINQ